MNLIRALYILLLFVYLFLFDVKVRGISSLFYFYNFLLLFIIVEFLVIFNLC